ncbi:glyoxalase/bleomycin resistance/extradiol dioxygenase family protein [Pleionea sp. CnH1-48]|uniref:VOC family protein n=1 Tax=Pleionea sp. CnH1-48 TaxID=2954494 RepID=UPI002096B908|nr:VOC family protein [Pleionea sp. CnH1-48]MCO7225639.1 VOC family protein [Pleionea sp. CnH1-48]
MTNTKLPISLPGYSRVCPYLMVENLEQQVTFLTEVFAAEVMEIISDNDGNKTHGEVKIGDVVIMMGQASSEHVRSSMNYVFVEQVDATYQKALAAGAESICEPDDRYYGLRECGVIDPCGNQWWIAQVVELLTPEEIQQRARAQSSK